MTTFLPFATPARSPKVWYDYSALSASGYTIADQFGSATRKTEAATYNGRSCLKMTGIDSTLQLNVTKSTSLDLQADAEGVFLLLASPDPYALEQGSATLVYCFPETSAGSNTPDTTNHLRGGVWAQQEVGDGWVLCYVPFALMTVVGSAAVTDFRTKKLSRVGIRVTVTGVAKPDIYVGGVWVGGASRAKVVLSYDGCYISQKTLAKAAHDLYGIPGTLYVARANVDAGANYLTSADLDAFYADGWAIAGHSNSNVSLSTLSLQEQIDHIGAFREWARGRGYTRGDGHWAWAIDVGTANADATVRATCAEAMRQLRLKSVRVGGPGSGVTHLRSNALALDIDGADRPQTVYAPQMTASLTADNVRAYVTPAIASRMTMHLYAHEIAANQGATVSGSATNFVTPAVYDETTTGASQSVMPWLSMIRAMGLVDLVTIHDWYRGLTQPQAVA